MAEAFDIACPDCGKQIKVTDDLEGKKIRCKECQAVFPVRRPAGSKGPSGAASKPTAKPVPAKPTAAKPPAAGKPPAPKPVAGKPPAPKPVAGKPPAGKPSAPVPPPKEDPSAPIPMKPLHDEEDDGPKHYGLLLNEDESQRCPHCAKEMEKGTVVCLECGYHLVLRTRTEQEKAVYEASSGDIFTWQLPAYLSILGILAFIGNFVFCWMMMHGWLVDSWFYDDTDGSFYVKPGCIILAIGLISFVFIFQLAKVAVKRLIVQPKPVEAAIERGDDDEDEEDDEFFDD